MSAPPAEQTTEGRRTRRFNGRYVPRWIGLATYLVAIVDIVSSLTHGLRHHFTAFYDLVPGALGDATAAATGVAGIMLLLLAHALRRRKKRAWRATMVLLLFSLVFHAAKFDPAGIVLAAALMVMLWIYRSEFDALGDPRTRWLAVRTFLLLLVISLVLGVAVIELRFRHIAGDASFGRVLEHVVLGLFGIEGPLTFSRERDDDLVGAMLFGLGLMTAIVTIYLALRPPEPRPRLSAQDESRMRDLLRRFGAGDSLGYFALRRDKSVIWSESGKSCIAYRVVSGVMLASGDPLGDPEAWPGAIARFVDEAERHAWTPAVIGCSQAGGEVWCRETSYVALELGDEAVVDIESFTLEGRPMRNVRQMVKRVERLGYETDVQRIQDLPPGEVDRLIGQARAWRGTDTERGFSMALGRLGDAADAGCLLVSATKDGALRAFLHFVPWGQDGISLDLMRRDRSADPGLNELLIVAALTAAPELGVRRASLNFAVFRAALERGERLGAGPVSRAWRGLLVFASRWFQIESLYRFNAKFRPQWQPRFLVYPTAGDLPRIGVAALEAEAFIVWPQLKSMRSLIRPRARASDILAD